MKQYLNLPPTIQSIIESLIGSLLLVVVLILFPYIAYKQIHGPASEQDISDTAKISPCILFNLQEQLKYKEVITNHTLKKTKEKCNQIELEKTEQNEQQNIITKQTLSLPQSSYFDKSPKLHVSTIFGLKDNLSAKVTFGSQQEYIIKKGDITPDGQIVVDINNEYIKVKHPNDKNEYTKVFLGEPDFSLPHYSLKQ